jgi:RNA-directed DNA polymerase
MTQHTLIGALSPRIRGWSNYYSRVVSAKIFCSLDHTLYAQLRSWAMSRHPNKSKHWIMGKYWRVDEGKGWRFQPPGGGRALTLHSHTSIHRHVKVQATRSPYDGDWVYWRTRLGRHPTISPRVAKHLRKQQGRCRACGLYFMEQDTLEVDHIIPKAQSGSEHIDNLQLLHRHCHVRKTAQDRKGQGTYDTRHGAEEPDDAKASRPVLNPSRGGDIPA